MGFPLPDHFTYKNIKKALEDPVVVARELNRIYYTKGYRKKNNGVDILDQDWDNLIILDACRFDMMQASWNREEEVKSVYSKGSDTVEFLLANFKDKSLLDTVYATANPQFHRHKDIINATFHDVIPVWEGENWNPQKGTIPPKIMTQHIMEAEDKYPNKKIIGHYLQPHFPPTNPVTDFFSTNGNEERWNIWDRKLLKSTNISVEEIWQEYINNLQNCLPFVLEVISYLDGKSVITADHGNAVGERSYPIPYREWGHPRGIYIDPLVRVPWIECDYDTRKSIKKDQSETEMDRLDDRDEEEIEERSQSRVCSLGQSQR